MKRLRKNVFSLVSLILIFSSCAYHETKYVARDLDSSILYPMYNTKIIDLKIQSKCPSFPSVKLVNTETRNEDLIVADIGVHTHYIKPNVLTDNIISYMSDAYSKCQVKVDPSSKKIIEVSIDKAEMKPGNGFTANGAFIQIKINIPETEYTNIFSAEDWSPHDVSTTMAYTIHVATLKMIEDPVIQSYILCK
jgi:hypothetical protein